MPTLATSLWTQDFPFYDFPHALISAAGYLWIGNQSNTGSLIRVDPNDPTHWAHLTFAADIWHGWVSDVIYIDSKAKIYCLMGTPNTTIGNTTISEVDPITLAYTDVIQTNTYNVEQGSMACDGTYLYVAARQKMSVYKYRISDWTLVDTLVTNMSLAHCCRIDGGKMYVSGSDKTKGLLNLIEITLSSFTITQSIVIQNNRIFTDDIAITPDHIFVGSEDTGNIVRISRTNFHTQTVINTGITTRNFGVYYDGTGLWTGWEGNPGIFGKIDVGTLALSTYQFAGANQISPNEFLRIGGIMYFTHYHLSGTLTAMSVSGVVPNPTPGSLLVSDRIILVDFLPNPNPENPGYLIIDSLTILDQTNTQRTQGTPNADTVTLSDSIKISYLGDYEPTDTLSLGDQFGIWNTTYYEQISLSEAIALSLALPAAADVPILVGDSYNLFDSEQFTDPYALVSVGDTLFLDDKQGVIENSTLDGYLRRYLNDVRR